MPRRVLPYEYNLPQIPQRPNGAYQPMQMTSPQQREPQQQQQVPSGLLGDLLKKPATPANALPSTADIMSGGWQSALRGTPWAGALGPATEAGYAPMIPAAYAADPVAALSASTEGAGLLGETAAGFTPGWFAEAGVAPALEAASAAPAVETGLLSGAADAAAADAAAGSGLLAGAGALAWPLGIGAGIYGLGSLFDIW